MVLVLASCASMQHQPGRGSVLNGARRNMPSIYEMARHKADAMDRELRLDAKQYRKIVRYYRAEIEKEREMMPSGHSDRIPAGGSHVGGPGKGVSEKEIEKFFIQQDRKLRRILTSGQYVKWRTRHPAHRMP